MIFHLSEFATLKKSKHDLYVFQVHTVIYDDSPENQVLTKRIGTYLNKEMAIKQLDDLLNMNCEIVEGLTHYRIQWENHDLDGTLENFQVFYKGRIQSDFSIANIKIDIS